MANLNGLKKYHFIYKTTNLKNGKFYVGMHSTNNLNDGYLGSGKRLKRSIKKYGVENFKLEILEFFDSRELLVEREKQLVNEELLKDTNCMNLKPGGTGGMYSVEHGIKLKKAASIYQKNKWKDVEYRNKIKLLLATYRIDNHKSGKIKYDTFTGKSHTPETKRKMSEAKKGKGTGKANSQFGTRWITNGTENKKIKKEEIVPTGWKAGRL
jgi:group I intron endonuclease